MSSGIKNYAGVYDAKDITTKEYVDNAVVPTIIFKYSDVQELSQSELYDKIVDAVEKLRDGKANVVFYVVNSDYCDILHAYRSSIAGTEYSISFHTDNRYFTGNYDNDVWVNGDIFQGDKRAYCNTGSDIMVPYTLRYGDTTIDERYLLGAKAAFATACCFASISVNDVEYSVPATKLEVTDYNYDIYFNGSVDGYTVSTHLNINGLTGEMTWDDISFAPGQTLIQYGETDYQLIYSMLMSDTPKSISCAFEVPGYSGFIVVPLLQVSPPSDGYLYSTFFGGMIPTGGSGQIMYGTCAMTIDVQNETVTWGTPTMGQASTSQLANDSNFETADNKVTSISSSSTDEEYPTAKAVYDALGSAGTSVIWVDH